MVLAALLGVVNAFDIPARQSFLMDMVAREDLMNAIALNSSMFNGARVIGPAIAGILVACIGEGWCFFANAVSYIAVIVGLLLMKLVPLRPAPKNIARRSSTSSKASATFGTPRRFWRLIAADRTGQPGGRAVHRADADFCRQVLHRGPHGLGILMGAAGVGAFFGASHSGPAHGLKGLGRVVGSRLRASAFR